MKKRFVTLALVTLIWTGCSSSPTPAPSGAPATSATPSNPPLFGEGLSVGDKSFQVIVIDSKPLPTLQTNRVDGEKPRTYFSRKIEGEVTKVETGDLNKDGVSEVYITVKIQHADGGWGAEIVAAQLGEKPEFSFTLPERAVAGVQGEPAKPQYEGFDEFSLTENRLVREYPLEGQEQKVREEYQFSVDESGSPRLQLVGP